MSFSKSQLDRLGDQLRGDEITAEDLRLLDEYRRSFSEGYEHVVRTIREQLGLEPTGRPAKSTTSIRDKLRRESIRLSQIQDIAGCRIVVPDVLTQTDAIGALVGKLGEMKIFDRREKPSHGYRAVHLIARCEGRPIEIQVRSAFQHMWAEFSEKAADSVDPALKYGGGPEPWKTYLLRTANIVAEREQFLVRLHKFKSEAYSRSSVQPDEIEFVRELENEMAQANLDLQTLLKDLSAGVSG